MTKLWGIYATLGSPPPLLNSFPNPPHNVLTRLMFHIITGKSLSVWSRGRPRYLKVFTPSIISPPSPPYRMNFIYMHLSYIFTYLCMSCLFFYLLYISICLCLNSLDTGICIAHWSHLSSSFGTSCRIATFDLQCQYMKCLLYIRPVYFNLKIHNGRKSPAKFFGLVVIKITKTNIIIPLWPSCYMPKKRKTKSFIMHSNITINS